MSATPMVGALVVVSIITSSAVVTPSHAAAPPSAMPESGDVLLDDADLDRLAKEFYVAFNNGGMSEVSSKIQACYSKLIPHGALSMRKNATYCVTFDTVASDIDTSFRAAIEKKFGSKAPRLDYYGEGAWEGRMRKYVLYISPSDDYRTEQAISAYSSVAEERLAGLMDSESGSH